MGVRDPRRDSWRLKLARAQQHLRELEIELGRYIDRHPYEATRSYENDPNPNRLFWRLRFTEQPDLHLAIVLGDVLTNIRAALDHIAVALAPHRPENKSAWFPIVADVGKFTPDPTPIQRAEHEKGRRSFCRAVKGMDPEAVTIIEWAQPYHIDPFPPSGTPQLHALRELNRLVQADKHKRLIPIASGLARARSFVFLRDSSRVQTDGWYADFHDEGAIVADFTITTPLTSIQREAVEAEVQVHIHGTPRITIPIVEGYGNSDLVAIVRDVIDFLGDDLFPSLEPFVKL